MEYIFTERAHLMCPNMCFALILSVNRSFDNDLLISLPRLILLLMRSWDMTKSITGITTI